MMPPGPGDRDSSPGTWSARSGPYGPYEGPRAPSPFAAPRPAKRAAPEVVPGGAHETEKRICNLEEHMAVFFSFRDEVMRQAQGTEAKLTHLHGQAEDAQKQLADVRSQLAAVQIELHQGLPLVSAQVQTNAQDLADMLQTAQVFIRDG